MRLDPSPEEEARLVRLLMVGSVAFFLFAATVLPPTLEPINSQKENDLIRRNNSAMYVTKRTSDETTREHIFNEIYKRTFTKLRDEKKEFLSPEEAKPFLPAYPDSRRKVNCGGWVTDIPSLVLRYMGMRCPPLDLL